MRQCGSEETYLLSFVRNLWFLSIFGDSLKSNIIYSSCTPRLHHVGEDKRCPHARASHMCTTVARTVLPWPATPRRMADDLSRTLAIMPHPASGGPRGDAASAWVCAGPSRGAPTKRRLRRSRCARPNIWRFSILRRLIWPSTGPLDQGSGTPALTAA